MKQVIIHAGFHKTATKSIQKSCAMNQDKLAKRGFYYPIFHLDDRVITNHSIPFYSLFTSEPEKFHLNVLWNVDPVEANKKYEEQLERVLEQKIEKIIISGEDIAGLSQLELERMRNKIYAYDYDIRVIVVVRAPLSYLNSSIQETVKTGYTIEDIKYHYNPSILKTRIETIESVFPQTSFFPFQDLLQHQYGPVGFFWETIGVSNFSNLEVFRANDSISDQATRLIDFINQEEPFYSHIPTKKLNPLRRHGDTVLINKLEGDRFQLKEDELYQFKYELEQANQYLSTKFNGSFCDKLPYNLSLAKNQSWSQGQIEQLRRIVPQLNSNIRNISYKYFKDIVCLEQKNLHYAFLSINQKLRTYYILFKRFIKKYFSPLINILRKFSSLVSLLRKILGRVVKNDFFDVQN